MFFVLAACMHPSETDTSAPLPSPIVPLRWVRGYAEDSWERSRQGMWWQLASLGALPPPGEPGITVTSESEEAVWFSLDLEQVGFPEHAVPLIVEAAAFVHDTDEVEWLGGLDLGPFFLRTLYEPWYYYQLTGACSSQQEWESVHHEGVDLAQYAVTESQLVAGNRLDIYAYSPDAVPGIAHLVGEGEGSIEEGTFQIEETESIDILPNGMLRYAVYGYEGEIQPWGLASPAGQPGKCMWCHEDHLQRGQETNPGAPGYTPTAEFLADLDAQQAKIAALRRDLATALVFDPPTSHDYGELLIETWLQPSVARLALEWSLSEAVVLDALTRSSATPHINDEYPEQGDVYTRAEAEAAWALLFPSLMGEASHGSEPVFQPVFTSGTAREPLDAPLVWGDIADLTCGNVE